MTKASHVTPGRLLARYRHKHALMIGTKGTKGTRKEDLISGCFFLKTMTAIAMTVPRFPY